MLTSEELKFVEYWKKNRTNEKRLVRQFLVGLPLGLVFAIFILINFLSGWFKRANMTAFSNANPIVLVIAILAIVVFFAIFYKMHQWDLKEQQYLELLNKSKENKPKTDS